jgi:hypothetical protein
MPPVVAKLVFVTSSALGAAALGTTAYLVENPRAFSPQPVRALDLRPITPRPMPPPPVLIPEPVVLEPVVVTGSKAPPASKAQALPKPVEEKTLVPCSDWEEMGPTSVSKDGSGVHRVRRLCN